MTAPPAASARETLEAAVVKAKWQAVPYRRAFLQEGKQPNVQPGLLASFVTGRETCAFDVYNLTKLLASAKPYRVVLSPQVVARALLLGSPGSVTKAVKRLAEKDLIQRLPGRQPLVRLLREDGSGKRYTAPWQSREAYFQVPVAYWTSPEQWHRKLTLPEKAMLFIALSRCLEITSGREGGGLPGAGGWVLG